MDIDEIMQRLQSGESLDLSIDDHAKIRAYHFEHTRREVLPRLEKARESGDWETFTQIALSHYEVMPDAFEHYEEVPDDLKYDFAISAYVHHGDRLEVVRNAVRDARRYGVPDLPQDIKEKDVLTVYRAGEETIEECSLRLSWTTSFDVAMFFYDEYAGRHANYLYQAQIKTSDIIAYTDDRKEKEVIQYGSVFDVARLEVTIL